MYENGLKLNLIKNGVLYTLSQEIKYNTDYVFFDFALSNNQSFILSSTEAFLIEDKNVYLSRGTVDNGAYSNRENVIELTILSESKIPYTYIIKLTKALSPINTIESISGNYNFLETTKPLDITFNNDVISINTILPYGNVSLNLIPVLNDVDSIYSKSLLHSYSFIIDGIVYDEISLPKKQGSNEIILRVTSEDSNTFDYVINYQMSSSGNNFLQDLIVSNGSENLILFDKFNNNYTIELEYNNNLDIYIEAIPSIDDSSNSENKIYISYGIDLEINSFTISSPAEGQTDTVYIKVISLADYELGNENYNIYEINITKAYDSDTSLYSLKVNDEDVLLSEDVFDYSKIINEDTNIANISLDYNYKNNIIVKNISYTDKFNQTTILNNEIPLNNFSYPLDTKLSGTYLVEITIKNPDESSISVYSIEIIKSISSNSTLSDIKVIDEILNNTYQLSLANDFSYNGINKYTINNPINTSYSIYQVKISGSIHLNAKYGLVDNITYNSGESILVNLKTGVNEIVIRVIAEDNSFKDYVFIIYRSKSSDASLSSLTLKNESNINLLTNFNASTYFYALGNIGANTSKLNLDFNLPSPIIGGKLSTVSIEVIDGSLTLTKLKTGSYELSNIDYANYQILITVLSENEEVTNTYVVEFSKVKSNDSKLSLLNLSTDKINNLVSDFSLDIYNYNLGSLTSEVSILYLSATVNDVFSKVAYSFLNSELNYVNELVEIKLNNIPKGINTIEVYVEAQDGTISIYSIEFIRDVSTNNLLTSLKVCDNLDKVQIGETNLNPNLVFDSLVNSYNLTLNPSINTLTIYPILSDTRANYSFSTNGIDFFVIDESFNINLGWNNDLSNNSIIIRVIAEDNTLNDYTISYTRYKDSSSIITDVFSNNATFTKNINEFKSTVNYDVSVLDLNISLDSVYATVTYSLNQVNYFPINKINEKFTISSFNLELGKNFIYIQVMAQDGSVSNYTIEINRLNLYYDIIVNQTNGGTLIHDELTNIPINSVIVLELIPDSNYHIKSIKVNGNEIITLNNNTPIYSDSHLTYGNGKYYYTFDPIVSNQKIDIEFDIDKYKVILSTNGFGLLNDSTNKELLYNGNSEVNLLIKPQIGYHLNKILINGVETTIDSGAYKYQEEILGGYNYLLTSNITNEFSVIAEFIKNTYTVTYKSNGYLNSSNEYVDLGNIDGSYYSVEEETFIFEFGQTIGNKTINSIEGYSSSWSVSSDFVVKSDLIVYGNYIAYDEVILRFIIDGQTVKYTSKIITPPNTFVTFDPVEYFIATDKIGYTFKWYLDGEEFDSSTSLNITEDTNIIGVYSLIEYDITYNLDGGVNSLTNITKYNVTTNFTFVSPTKTGYVFEGWYKETEFINLITDINSGQTNSIELFAKFIPANNTLYQIIYMTQNIDGSYSIFETENLTGTTNSHVFAINKDILGFTYNFTHVDNIVEGNVLPDGSLKLYLYYSRNTYNVVINVIGEGSITLVNSSYKYNEVVSIEASPNLGSSFIGWYHLDNLINANINYTFNMPANDLEIDALFTLDNYNITYYLYEGTQNLRNPLTYNVYTKDIILNSPEKLGHSFEGWYTDELFTEEVNVITKGSIGDITLYAYFIIDTFDIEFAIIGDGTVLLDDLEVEDVINKPYGSNLTFIFNPSIDYFVNSLKVNGVVQDLKEEYIIDNLSETYFIEIEFIKTEPDVLTLKQDSGYGNKIYNIDRTGDINLFSNYFLNQNAGDIRLSFENSHDRIKFFNLSDVEITDDKILGTGYSIKLYKDNTYKEVIDEVYVILSGDINGDGRANATDLNFVYRHVKMTLLITDFIKNKAGNLTTGKTITATYLNLLYRHVKMNEEQNEKTYKTFFNNNCMFIVTNFF